MSEPDANGWLPIEEMPEGRCLMWVADSGFGGTGQAVFGVIYVYPDSRSYRPDNHHGDWNVTHVQHIKPPVSEASK